VEDTEIIYKSRFSKSQNFEVETRSGEEVLTSPDDLLRKATRSGLRKGKAWGGLNMFYVESRPSFKLQIWVSGDVDWRGLRTPASIRKPGEPQMR